MHSVGFLLISIGFLPYASYALELEPSFEPQSQPQMMRNSIDSNEPGSPDRFVITQVDQTGDSLPSIEKASQSRNVDGTSKVRVTVRVKLVMEDLGLRPVARREFEIRTSNPRDDVVARVKTSFEGDFNVQLSAGEYHVRSVEPLTTMNKTISWDIAFVVPATGDFIVELSNDNAAMSSSGADLAAPAQLPGAFVKPALFNKRSYTCQDATHKWSNVKIKATGIKSVFKVKDDIVLVFDSRSFFQKAKDFSIEMIVYDEQNAAVNTSYCSNIVPQCVFHLNDWNHIGHFVALFNVNGVPRSACRFSVTP